MTKQEKDKIAEKCFLYEKYFGIFKGYLRFNKDDFYDIQSDYNKASDIFKRKMFQLNSIIFTLDLLYSSNNYYDLSQRELFSWCIGLMSDRLKFYLEQTLIDLTKKE